MIIRRSSKAQWYDLLYLAQQQAAIFLSLEIEQYLISLCMRTTNDQHLLAEPVAIKLLESLNGDLNRQGQLKLQHVGDQCLLLVGLFPQLSQRRNVSLSYCTEVGQTAYSTLSEAHFDEFGRAVFTRLTDRFNEVSNLLSHMRMAA